MNFSLFHLNISFSSQRQNIVSHLVVAISFSKQPQNQAVSQKTPKRTPSVLQNQRGITNSRHKRRQAFFKSSVASQTDATNDAKRSETITCSQPMASSFLEPYGKQCLSNKDSICPNKATTLCSQHPSASRKFLSKPAVKTSCYNQLLESAATIKNQSAVSTKYNQS